MNIRFKPLLAAAVAAGAFNLTDLLEQSADGATVANFTFEANTATFIYNSSSSVTATGGSSSSVGSISYLADSGVGTFLGVKSTTSGNFGFAAGNGSTKAIAGNSVFGVSYSFRFSIDDLSTVAIGFDQGGSVTGPRDFVVQYSTDGVTYTSFATYALSTVSSTFTNTSASSSGTNTVTTFNSFAFTAPSAFSDSSTDPGDFGFLRLLQSGATNITGGGASATGTNRLDNVLIGDMIPEPASGSILTLAAAGLLLKRRRLSTEL